MRPLVVLAVLLVLPVSSGASVVVRSGVVSAIPSAVLVTDGDQYDYDGPFYDEFVHGITVTLTWEDPRADLDLRVRGTGPICDVQPCCPQEPCIEDPCEGHRRDIQVGPQSETFSGIPNGFQLVEFDVDPALGVDPVAYTLTLASAAPDADARLSAPQGTTFVHTRAACRAVFVDI